MPDRQRNTNPRKGTETFAVLTIRIHLTSVRETRIPVRGRRRKLKLLPNETNPSVRETRIPVRGRRPDSCDFHVYLPVRQRNTNPRKGTETNNKSRKAGSATRGQRNTNPRKGTETILWVILMLTDSPVRETRIPVRGRRPFLSAKPHRPLDPSQRNTNPRKGTETFPLRALLHLQFHHVRETRIPVRGRRQERSDSGIEPVCASEKHESP